MVHTEIIVLFKRKKFLMGLLLFLSSASAVGGDILIKSASSSDEKTCQYEALNIDSSGTIVLQLNNYQSCIEQDLQNSREDKNCSVNGQNYNIGTSEIFYKNANTNCSEGESFKCTNDNFPPDGYPSTLCNDSTLDGDWLPDPHAFGSFTFSNELYAGTLSPDTYQVRTLDSKDSASLPSCYNRTCSSPSDFKPGAREDTVYAIRGGKRDGAKTLEIEFSFDRLAPDITSSKYDVTISGIPGQIKKSDFIGKGCVNTNNTLQRVIITLYKEKVYQDNKAIFDVLQGGCYIPSGREYYINFKARNKECNNSGKKKTDSDGKFTGEIVGPCTIFFER